MTAENPVIIDSHCHAWAYWPYGNKPPEPAVPDPESRGRVEQLVYEMQVNRVDQALIVCAQIDHNPDNNAYIASQVQRFPERLHQAADLDCEWSPTYHTPGAAGRLRRMAERWPLVAFTHYLRSNDDGAWLTSEEGLKLFETAAELNLMASLACLPHQHAAIGRLAERYPSVPILIHHLAHVGSGNADPGENLRQVMASAAQPNIYLKVSGFAYAANALATTKASSTDTVVSGARQKWEYPYSDVAWILQAEYQAFGPDRLCWGSDYPVVSQYMTYQQSLEVFRNHYDFIPPADKGKILGENLAGLLVSRKKSR